MRALFLLTAALPLAACDIHQNGDDKTVLINTDNGAVAFEVPGVKGSIKLPGAMMAHSNMEIDGVKLMAGSKVNSVHVIDNDVTIGFTTPGTMAAVKAYYAREFAAKGVSATAQGDGFGGKTRDGDDFTLSFAETNGGTAGTMKIHDKG